MLKSTFKTKNGYDRIFKIINKKNKRLKRILLNLGIATANKMKETIKSNKKRPQAGEPTTLENNIQFENLSYGQALAWGVGNINKLNRYAPYWRAVNYGSSHMVGRFLPIGQFAPGNPIPNQASFRQGRWKAGGGNYPALVQRPIPPMNYIETTQHWFRRAIDKLFIIMR